MNTNSKTISGRNEVYQALEFSNYVNHEKMCILSNTRKNPCQILIDVFDLCIDNFDGLDLEKQQPELYDCLMQLYNANQKKALMDSLEENITTIYTVVELFLTHDKEIRSIDCQLYYALLNFIDMLKTVKGKHIYFNIVP